MPGQGGYECRNISRLQWTQLTHRERKRMIQSRASFPHTHRWPKHWPAHKDPWKGKLP